MLSRNHLLVLFACMMLIPMVGPTPTPLAIGADPVVHVAAAAVPTSAPPIPLPHSSGGGLPPGTPSMAGYVYLDGRPREGAKVTIAGAHGITETWTISQSNNLQPYYTMILSDSQSLLARVGETITVTAEYSAHTRTITTTVFDSAQQVDVVLPRQYPEDYAFDRQFPRPDQLQLSPPGQLTFPTGVVADGRGAIYVVDWGNARVQAFNRAGRRLPPPWGSFGNARGELAGPQGIAVDRDGNFYVADTFNFRIQKFTSVGTLLSVWGSQGSGNGQFNAPFGIALDHNGNVYVSDYLNQRIQKFSSSGTYLTQWGSAGQMPGEFNFPVGVAVDSQNNVYVADRDNNRIQKFDSAGVFITQWLNGGDNVLLNKPQGIAVDSHDNVYVTDWGHRRVQKYASNGTYLSGWGNQVGETVRLSGPWGIAIDSADNDTVYVVDNAAQTVLRYNSDGHFLNRIGVPASGEGPIVTPVGTAVDSAGNVYVTEWDKDRVRIFSPDGEALDTWSRESGTLAWRFDHPTGIAVDSADNVYVADTGWQEAGHQRVLKFDSTGMPLHTFGGAGINPGQFIAPTGIAIDQAGNIYVTDYGAPGNSPSPGHRVQKFLPNGTALPPWGSYGSGPGQFIHPTDIAVDGNGIVYVTDAGNNRIQRLTSDGTFLTPWVSQGTDAGEIVGPTGVAVDSDNKVYAAEGGDLFGTAHYTHYHVQEFSSTGTLISNWGSPGGADGQFVNPLGVAVDKDHAVYVADLRNNRLQRFARMSYTRPIATLVSVPEHVDVGQPIIAHGAGSDSDDTTAIQDYEWTLSNTVSGTLVLTTTAMMATFDTTHLAPGRYRVTLRVRDTEGEISDPQTTAVDLGRIDTWTFLLYLDADTSPDGTEAGSLARYLSIDSPDGALYRIQHELSNPGVHIAVLYDGPGDGDSHYYLSQSDGRLALASPPKPGTDEINMGDPQALIDFVSWGQQHAPADHYYLAIADHANGLDGIAWDYTSAVNGSAHLTNATLLQALAAITQNKQRIDVLHLDGCLMGLVETSFQLRDTVRYLISSENLAWSVFAYSDYRAAIQGTTTPAELSRAILTAYANAVQQGGAPYTIAALGMDSPRGESAQMNDVAKTTHALAKALTIYARLSEENRGRLMTLRNTSVQKLDSNGDNVITIDDQYIDLDHWAELVQALPDALDTTGHNVAEDVRVAADDLRVALRSLVVLAPHDGAQLANARGVSIYFPPRTNTRPYAKENLEFLAREGWGEFLKAVLDPQQVDLTPSTPNPVPPLPIGTAPLPRIYFPVVLR
jgi:sugar lactone lactonase YvrE